MICLTHLARWKLLVLDLYPLRISTLSCWAQQISKIHHPKREIFQLPGGYPRGTGKPLIGASALCHGVEGVELGG